jgi:hypothetical protein
MKCLNPYCDNTPDDIHGIFIVKVWICSKCWKQHINYMRVNNERKNI